MKSQSEHLCPGVVYYCSTALPSPSVRVICSGQQLQSDLRRGLTSKPESGISVQLVIEQTQVSLVRGKETIATIPAAAITEISYGQDVHRRVGSAIALALFTYGAGALLALSKSKKHFVGLTWVDGDKKGGLAVQCDKNDYRGVLAGLEGITGKKAVNSEAMTVKN